VQVEEDSLWVWEEEKFFTVVLEFLEKVMLWLVILNKYLKIPRNFKN
jgi:hypothetical protein